MNGFGTLVESHLTMDVRDYFWALHFIPLVYMPIFVPDHTVLITITL